MPAEVDALMSAKLDAGYSVSTVRRIRALLVEVAFPPPAGQVDVGLMVCADGHDLLGG